MSKNHKRRSVYFADPIERYLDMVGEENYSGSINIAIDRYLFLVSDFPLLSKEEWLLINDAMNGVWINSTFYRNPSALLAIEISDACRIDKLDKKWGVSLTDLLIKISGLTKSQAFAVFHVLDVFRGHKELSDEELLTKAGLKFPKQNT